MKINEIKRTEIKREVGYGEESLHKEYNYKTKSGLKDAVLIGIDAGSTQTRTMLVRSNDDLMETIYSLPSVSSLVTDDRELIPSSELLYDNLDSQIIDMSSGVPDRMFSKLRIVRGQKHLNSNTGENRIDSTNQKIDSLPFYINILDSIGYSLVQSYSENGEDLPAEVDLAIGVALPPDDMKSSANQAKFKNRILGTFNWTMVGYPLTIKMNICSVSMMTEPQANYSAYRIQNDKEEVPYLQLHCDGGGRSIGLEIIKEGVRMDSGSRTLAFGGTQLIDLVRSAFYEEKGGKPLPQKNVEKALYSGSVKRGKDSLDIVEFITSQKRVMAEKIYNGIINEIFDQQTKISFEDLERISLSGKLFFEGEYGVSIVKFLQDIIAEKHPDSAIEYVVYEENLIPYGLLVEAYGDNPEFVQLTEDEVASDEIEE